jgi:hypothetical protein
MQLRKLPTNTAKLEDAVQLQTDAPTDVSRIKFALDPDLACVRVIVGVLWVDVAILRLTPDPDLGSRCSTRSQRSCCCKT